MRKIIKNKVYDTDTAIYQAERNSKCAVTDLNYFKESLYIKKTGEFLLHGEGNGLSKYATQYNDGNYGFGEKIIPLTYEEAQEWSENYLEADEYEKNLEQLAMAMMKWNQLKYIKAQKNN